MEVGVQGRGVTRTVLRVHRWAIKLPGGHGGYSPERLLRGWLANRSEWKDRHRPDVIAPVFSLGGFLNVYPLADALVTGVEPQPWNVFCGYSHEEAKWSSWGCFDGRWLLLDYDRAWQPEGRGWVGRWYYGRMERRFAPSS